MSQLQDEYEKYVNVSKRILKKELSTNSETLRGYRQQIIEAYNGFVTWVRSVYFKVDVNAQKRLQSKTEAAQEKLVLCFKNLKISYVLPDNIYDDIDEDLVENIAVSTIVPPRTYSGYNKEEETEEQEREERERLEKEERERKRNMADAAAAQLVAQKTILDILNAQIRKPYEGDPLKLAAFVTSVKIAQDFATSDALKLKLVEYVKGRLDGRARELITDDIDNIEDLLTTLKGNISPEKSNIISGRLIALRYSYAKQEEFAEKAEELANALRRTLVFEGIPAKIAEEKSVEETVKLCRKFTNSDVGKAVLDASTFKTPKDVIAKLITSNEQGARDKQILHYKQNAQRQNPGRGKFGRGRGGNNFRNNNQNFNNYNNYNGGFNGRYNNNYRGRGGFKGRGNNNYGRGYNQNSGNRYQGSQQNGGNWRINHNPNVRLAQTGNVSVPQALMGGPQIRQID